MVNFLEFFPWTWMLHFVRALITCNVVFTVLKNKKNAAITFFSIVLSSLIYSYVSILNLKNNTSLEYVVMIMYYVLQFLIICLVTEGSVFSKLFCPIFSLIIYVIGTSTYGFIDMLFSRDNSVTAKILDNEIPLTSFVTTVLATYSSSFIFIIVIRFIQYRTKKKISYNKKLTLLFIFPITHLLYSYTSIGIINFIDDTQRISYYKTHPNIEAIFILVTIVCVFLDFSIIPIANHIEKTAKKNIQIEKELVKNRLMYQQMKMLKDEKQEFMKIKHDYANILATIKGFIEIDKPEKALAIIQGADDDLKNFAGFSLCANETINTILYIKSQQAKSKNIELNTIIDESHPLFISDYDMCRILSNLLDNAINAIDKLESDRVCNIYITIDDTNVILRIVNKYQSSITSKAKNNDEHGHGISIIEKIASKYGGKYSLTKNNGIWDVTLCMQNKSIANCPANFE